MPSRQLLPCRYQIRQRVLVSKRNVQQRHWSTTRRELYQLYPRPLLWFSRPHRSDGCMRSRLLLWRRQLRGYSLRYWQVLVVPSRLRRRQLCGDVEHDLVRAMRQWPILRRHMRPRDQHHHERHLSTRSLLSSRQRCSIALPGRHQLVIGRLDGSRRMSTMYPRLLLSITGHSIRNEKVSGWILLSNWYWSIE